METRQGKEGRAKDLILGVKILAKEIGILIYLATQEETTHDDRGK